VLLHAGQAGERCKGPARADSALMWHGHEHAINDVVIEWSVDYESTL
jgi:hypothetical protein